MIALLVFVASPAAADMYDEFWIDVDAAGDPNPTLSGGTGYPGNYPEEMGEWYWYENYGWWNQWFYDGQFKPPPWYKVVHVEFDLTVRPGGSAQVALNWTTQAWSDQGLGYPPLPPLSQGDEDSWIMREPFDAGTQHVVWDFVIQDYNPEWVSIDVRGTDFTISGWIEHDCIPEPASLSLLAIGGLMLLRRKQ
jgi:hypothetical protein